MGSERDKFKGKVDVLEQQGLKSISLYLGDVEDCSPEDFFAEANRLFEVIEMNRGRPLSFGDSRKK